jgi:membrane protease YdiL (CAAX protease family)
MMGAFAAVAMLVLTAGVFCWTLTVLRLAVGWRLLPQELEPAGLDVLKFFYLSPRASLVDWRPRRPVTWGLVDLVAIVFLFGLLALGVGQGLRQGIGLAAGTDIEDLTLGQRKILTIGNMAVSMLLLLICMPLIALRPGTSWRDFGWSLATLGRDVRLGLIGFVMLAPPVYAIQGVLVYFWHESKHPLMEMFKGTPDAAFFATLFAAAVVVAPLFEEMLFRVFLQGWLEKLASCRASVPEVLLGRFSVFDQQVPLGLTEQPVVAQLAVASPKHPVIAGFTDSNPHLPPTVDESLAKFEPALPAVSADDQPELRAPQAWLPIAISSVIFALLHMSHGPDWVALTFLAAGMGYLYQRTHSVIPSLVVHLCLNGLSMWGLWVQVYELKGAGL